MRAGLAFLMVALSTGFAGAEPVRAGSPFPTVRIEDLDGHPRTLPRDPSRPPLPLVLIWEDDKSSKQKQPAHDVVGRYSDNRDNRPIFELVLVADLERWDFWPAKKHAIASIKKTQTKESTPVWVDWKGTVRKELGLSKNQSAFAVVDKDGVLRFLAQGQLDESQRHALDAAIAALGAKPAAGRR